MKLSFLKSIGITTLIALFLLIICGCVSEDSSSGANPIGLNSGVEYREEQGINNNPGGVIDQRIVTGINKFLKQMSSMPKPANELEMVIDSRMGVGFKNATDITTTEIEEIDLIIPVKKENNQWYAIRKDSYASLSAEKKAFLYTEESSDTIPIRIYRPKGDNLPVIMFYHGGGWTSGSIANVDKPARYLAEAANALVISVEYRMGPEYPFPVFFEDSYAALIWAEANASKYGGDSKIIGTVGDSAGGHLSTAVAMMARDQQGPKISFQGLIYPAVVIGSMESKNFTKDYFAKTSFFKLKKSSQLFHRKLLVGMVHRMYSSKIRRDLWILGDPENCKNPYMSPLLAESLAGMPETLIVCGEFDPLIYSNVLYANRLADSGVKTGFIRYNGQTHGFMDSIGGDDVEGAKPESRMLIDDIADAFKSAIERN